MSSLSIARWLMFSGALLFIAGASVYLLSRLGVQLFNLPGDIRIQTENVTCLIPIASMILISVLLSVILSLALRFLNK